VYSNAGTKVFEIASDYADTYESSSGKEILTTNAKNEPIKYVSISTEEGNRGTKWAEFSPTEVVLHDTSRSGGAKDKNIKVSEGYATITADNYSQAFPFAKYDKTRRGDQNVQVVNLFNGLVMTYQITYVGSEVIELPDQKRVTGEHYAYSSFYKEYQESSKDLRNVWLDAKGRVVLSLSISDADKSSWLSYWSDYDSTKTSGTYITLKDGKYYSTEQWSQSLVGGENRIRTEYQISPLLGGFLWKSSIAYDDTWSLRSYKGSWQYSGGEETQTTTFAGNKLQVRTQNSYGEDRSTAYDVPSKSVFRLGWPVLYRSLLTYFDLAKKGPQQIKTMGFDGKVDSSTTAEYLSEEAIEVAGRTVSAKKIRFTFKDWSFHRTLWFDQHLLLLRSETVYPQKEGTGVVELVEWKGNPLK
jgi:hypothetical protein